MKFAFHGTCARDPRLNFEHNNFDQFRKLAWLAIIHFGWDAFTFEGDGIELDPVSDLGIPENVKLKKSAIEGTAFNGKGDKK